MVSPSPKSDSGQPNQGFTGILSWFAQNHVAANLLMIAVVTVGVLVARNIRQEIYPTYTLDEVEVDVEVALPSMVRA